MARDLNKKLIVITGASSGIGAATARACAAAGMNVVLAARREQKLRQIATEIEQMGRRALIVNCDVSQDDEVARLFEQSWKTFGRLDALFANAGYGLFASVMETTDRQARAILETNYFGTIRCLRAGVPQLRKTPGGLSHVLICSSVVSEVSPAMHGFYAATKAAQDAIAGALRGELAVEGIHVTSVHPVGTRTEFFNTPARKMGKLPPFSQSADHVARKIVGALRRPRAEVWPLPAARLAMGLATAMPGLTAWIIKLHGRRLARQATAAAGATLTEAAGTASAQSPIERS